MRPPAPRSFQIRRLSDEIILENDRLYCRFTRPCAGFPAAVGFAEDEPLLAEQNPILQADHVDFGAITPCLARWRPRVVRRGKIVRVCFDDIAWQDAAGDLLPGLRLTLAWEFHPEGVAFAETHLAGEDLSPGAMTSFRLAPGFSLRRGEQAHWSYWKRPTSDAATIIQALGECERFLPHGQGRSIPGGVVPYVGVDFGQGPCRDRHIEFFLESGNSLAAGPDDCRTDIAWTGRSLRVGWEFCAATQSPPPGRTWQWRNVWGFCLTRTPSRRRAMPWRIVHYLDNFQRLPTPGQLKQIAAEGADLLILHENWRLAMPEGAIPHDPAGLKRTLRLAHRLGLRVALYARGNEQNIREQAGQGFADHLEYNRDGIYLDYGCAVCYQSTDESAPAGRVHFREYFQALQRLRQTVGPEGVLISHAGPFPAALGHLAVDAYLGGEQEKGRLFESPTAQAVFSSLSNAPAALWTAAFPAYRDPAVLPALARSLQTPFIHLGTQMPTSSLAQPCSMTEANFARPLWRLLELFAGQRNLRCFTTGMSGSPLQVQPRTAGASCLITGRGEVLVLLGNDSRQRRTVRLEPDWDALGLPRPEHGWALRFPNGQPSAEPCDDTAGPIELPLPAHGIGGFLLADKPGRWNRAIRRFSRDWPAETQQDRVRKRQIDELRSLRFDPPAREQIYLRVRIPNWANTYEESLWIDLFQNEIRLVLLAPGLPPRPIGVVTTDGLKDAITTESQRLWPGLETPWIPLHTHLEKMGLREATVRLETVRQGEPFYSFVEAELTDQLQQASPAWPIRYDIAIDRDWSVLEFLVRMKQP